MRRTGAATQLGRDPGMQRVFDLLGRDEVDVGIKPARGQDLAFPGNRLGARTDDDVDAGLRVGVARLADARNPAVLQSDIGLVDACDIHNQSVCDDRIHSALRAGDLGLPHAVANDLSAAKFDLFSVGCEVFFNFNHQVSIRQTHLVARGGAIHVGISGARYFGRHGRLQRN